MLINKHIQIVIVFIILIAGCSTPAQESPTKQTNSTSTKIAGSTYNPFTPSPTLTKIPTTNTINTVSPSYTPSVHPSVAWTAMSPTEQFEYWIGLISTNNGCELPCWLGLMPGKATEEDISNFFYPITGRNSILPITNYVRKDHFPIMKTDSGLLELYFDFYEQNGILFRIYVATDILNKPLNDPRYDPALTDAMQIYSLDKVLTKYGVPSRAYLGITEGPSEPGAPWLYHLYVIYDNLGFMIYYEGGDLHRSGDTISVCPSYQKLSYINLFLQSPESESTLDTFLKEIYGLSLEDMSLQGKFMDIKSATNLSTEDFYLKLRQSYPETCIETNATLWH